MEGKEIPRYLWVSGKGYKLDPREGRVTCLTSQYIDLLGVTNSDVTASFAYMEAAGKSVFGENLVFIKRRGHVWLFQGSKTLCLVSMLLVHGGEKYAQ